MRVRQRIVADTNCLVSHLLLPSSVPGDAVRKAADSGLLLVSETPMNELADVLARLKFDRYISLADRQQFLRCSDVWPSSCRLCTRSANAAIPKTTSFSKSP